MNTIILIGRLTRDPETNTAASGTTVARYTLAVDRRSKDKGADYINCVAFGRNAEFAEKYLHQGTKIAVEGRIQTGSYKNKNGDTVYTTDIVVEQHEFCEPRKAQEATQQGVTDTLPNNGSSGNSRPLLDNFEVGFEEEFLPFK